MMLRDTVFAQAALLAGQLDEQQSQLLQALCQSVVAGLQAQLRDGLTAEDCGEAFVTAASLYALAAFRDAGQNGGIAEFRAGDLTVKQNPPVFSARCLQQQAQALIQPFLKDRFVFLGV